MSKTVSLINSYYNLLEYTISPEKQEYYGCSMSLSDFKDKYQVVCTDKDCTDFKDSDQVKPGDVVYIQDDDGDLSSVKINE